MPGLIAKLRELRRLHDESESLVSQLDALPGNWRLALAQLQDAPADAAPLAAVEHLLALDPATLLLLFKLLVLFLKIAPLLAEVAGDAD